MGKVVDQQCITCHLDIFYFVLSTVLIRLGRRNWTITPPLSDFRTSPVIQGFPQLGKIDVE